MVSQDVVYYLITVATHIKKASTTTRMIITQSPGRNFTSVVKTRALTFGLLLKAVTSKLGICCSSVVAGKKRMTVRVMPIVPKQRSGMAQERMVKTVNVMQE
jgi:hypothetical protein